MTSNLVKWVWEHRDGVVEGFSKKYSTKQLVFFEMHDSAESAITREKQIEKWGRKWKLELVQTSNPWHDLWSGISN